MPQPRSRTFRVVRNVGIGLSAIAALYLLAGNLLLRTRLLRTATNMHPEQLMLEYESAYTIFPGHAYVKGLTLRFEDRNIRFGLAIDEGHVRIGLLELIQKKFHATRVRATGVSWRMLHKVQKLEGNEKRVAAFAKIEGFSTPLTIERPPDGPPGTGEGLWSVHLDDVEVEVRELWMLEYRYVGVGHASGSFELKPMKSVWVGPATLELKAGSLTAGAKVVSKNFAMQLGVTMTPVDIPSALGLAILKPLSASVQIAALIDDLGAAELYAPGLEASGNGTLTAEVWLANGVLTKGSVIEAHLGDIRLRSEGSGFNGTVNANFKLAPDAHGVDVPVVHAAASGAVLVSISKTASATAAVPAGVADLSLTTADLCAKPGLQWLHTRSGEVRVEDARSLTAAASKTAPVVAPRVLGDGPLVMEGSADVTHEQTQVRLERASLGGAELKGCAAKTGESWSGAAAGKVAKVPIGLRMKNNALEVQPFVGDGWLAEQLGKLGLPAR